MNSTEKHLLHLPNEILFKILKKLNKMDVLYSLVGIGIEQLDLLVQDQTFTNTLNFTSTDSDDIICSINGSLLDRFCIDILPQVQSNVRCLVVEAITMPRILSAGDYPNLTKLKIFQLNDEAVSRCITDESTFGRIFKQQITDLTVRIDDKYDRRLMMHCTKNVYARIVSFFQNLINFNIDHSCYIKCPPLSFSDLPSTTFVSSTLTKLSAAVNDFEDCLRLLDGRLEQLSSFTVTINNCKNSASTMPNSDNLPDLKYFSLTYYITAEYDTHVVPLLRRMCNLQELTLYIYVHNRATFVDGKHLHDEILIHMRQLQTFTFYIRTSCQVTVHVDDQLSNDDIKQTFISNGYEQVACIVQYMMTNYAICHAFSFPFAFDCLHMLGKKFPNIIFNNVTLLMVFDYTPFDYEFFVRIARSFPLLRSFQVKNLLSTRDQFEFDNDQFDSDSDQSDSDSDQFDSDSDQFESDSIRSESDSNQFEFDNNQSYTIVEYPHLRTLNVSCAHIDYIDQLLDESKTRLPQLTELEIDYKNLRMVTKNFTRDATRLNCSKVKKLDVCDTMAYPEELYRYFPLL